MAIPSSQLEVWSKQGSIALSSATYQSIKNALLTNGSPLAAMITDGTISVSLQGSYAHDTNIYGDSDVDVIVRHGDTFHSNKLQLPLQQYQLHEQHYSTAPYQWRDLRQDVISTLQNYYGTSDVDTSGKKSIKVGSDSGRLRADIVPAVEYRRYSHFYSPASHSREDGIAFYNTATNELVVNYPDQHYANAVAKQALTNDRYKALVRVIKNMRSYLADRDLLTKEEAPSYFLQGMIYNVPPSLFTNDLSSTTLEALRWINGVDLSQLGSQNGQHALIGSGDIFWNSAHAVKTVSQLSLLWDNWGNY